MDKIVNSTVRRFAPDWAVNLVQRHFSDKLATTYAASNAQESGVLTSGNIVRIVVVQLLLATLGVVAAFLYVRFVPRTLSSSPKGWILVSSIMFGIFSVLGGLGSLFMGVWGFFIGVVQIAFGVIVFVFISKQSTAIDRAATTVSRAAAIVSDNSSIALGYVCVSVLNFVIACFYVGLILAVILTAGGPETLASTLVGCPPQPSHSHVLQQYSSEAFDHPTLGNANDGQTEPVAVWPPSTLGAAGWRLAAVILLLIACVWSLVHVALTFPCAVGHLVSTTLLEGFPRKFSASWRHIAFSRYASLMLAALYSIML